MDRKRAIQIASSPIMANVTYDGMGIYIENIDENKGTAKIHPLHQPEKRQDVPISSLIEH